MYTQTATTFVAVTQKAQDVIYLGRRHHWRFRIITDFQGVIDRPVYNASGDWLYMPLKELDKPIIPKAAFRRHDVLVKAGFRVAQVLIGHEITVAPEETTENFAPAPTRESQIDWRNVAGVVGTGLLIGAIGVAMVSLSALTGTVALVDPSYCIVLAEDESPGTVIELIRWNTEINNGTTPQVG